MYDDQPEAAGTSLPADERSHARLLRQVSAGVEGGTLARFEGRHRAVGGNALRAAVLGANDGLVSNFSLVMGVAGADPTGRAALIAGLAGLLAGALSMALGEWLSVQSARELYANQIAVEAEELEAFPQEEQEELRLIYEAKGLPPEQAAADGRAAGRRATGPWRSTRWRARSWASTRTSWAGRRGSRPGPRSCSSPLGAIVPVIPFLFGSGLGGRSSSRPSLSGPGALRASAPGSPSSPASSALISGARQLGFGLAAAAITFGIGTLLGTAIT